MLIRGAPRTEIEKALEKANVKFDGNIVFKRLDPCGHTRQGAEKHTVTLTVKSSSGPGARRSQTGRKIAAACWHAHGYFMDALPENTEIVSAYAGTKKPGDNWEDFNIGSVHRPFYASWACEC